MKPDVEETLRALGDIIETIHRAISVTLGANDSARFAVHDSASRDTVIGRLVERGLHDELAARPMRSSTGSVDGFITSASTT